MDADDRAMYWDMCSVEATHEAAQYGQKLTAEGTDWVRQANIIANQTTVDHFIPG